MIKQISDQVFSFTFREIPPECKWGDEPRLDNLGVVSHLLPTFEITDKKQYSWIKDNNILYSFIITNATEKCIRFDNIEDAMAFKLRWL